MSNGLTGHLAGTESTSLIPGIKTKKASIQIYEFASGRKIPILTLPRKATLGLSISRDEKSILFTQEKLSESRIVLVKNFSLVPRAVPLNSSGSVSPVRVKMSFASRASHAHAEPHIVHRHFRQMCPQPP